MKSSYDPHEFDTMPKLLARNARLWPDEIALREKALGIWRETSWRHYEDSVKTIALGLSKLGLGRGEVVAIIGDNRPFSVKSVLAVHACGALSLGLYRDSLDDEITYLLEHAGTRFVVAEDEEQVDKILPHMSKVPSLQKIIYVDPRGLTKTKSEYLLPLSELEAVGRRRASEHPCFYEELVQRQSGDDPAILCLTSGTTARPKMAVLTSKALLQHANLYLECDPRGPGDNYVSILPFAWIMEQVYALAQPLIARFTVNFVEEPSTMVEDMREIGPSFILLAPRQWEQIAADVHVRVEDGGRVKQALFKLATKLALRALKDGKSSFLADQLAHRALRDRLGFSRLRSAATGGASLGPETFRFFQAIGIPLRQLYGQTELIGAYTMHRKGDVDHETVGRPFDSSIEVRIREPDSNGLGEIVTRHPNMFSGYYKNDAAALESFKDGWLLTGDAGYFDEKDHLVVVDRVRDLAITSSGVRFSPQNLENKLKFSSSIQEAVVLGDGRPNIAVLIAIRHSVVARWAERRNIAFTTYADLAANPRVRDLLKFEVERVNRTLPSGMQIAKFALLYKELDADDGELTRTRKLKRSVINERYADIIEALYNGDRRVEIDTTVTLQDGTKQRVQTTIEIVDCATTRMDEAAA